MAVVATFTDSSHRDVTRLTNFSSSDPAVADVNLNGLVEFKRPGDVAILCRYLEEIVTVRLTYLEPKANFVMAESARRESRGHERLREAEADDDPAVGRVYRSRVRPPGLPRRDRPDADRGGGEGVPCGQPDR